MNTVSKIGWCRLPRQTPLQLHKENTITEKMLLRRRFRHKQNSLLPFNTWIYEEHKRFVMQMHFHHNTTACPFQWFITHSHVTQHVQTHSPSSLYHTQTWLTLICSLYHCFINSSHMLGGNGPCRGSGVRLCSREMDSRAVGPDGPWNDLAVWYRSSVCSTRLTDGGTFSLPMVQTDESGQKSQRKLWYGEEEVREYIFY